MLYGKGEYANRKSTRAKRRTRKTAFFEPNKWCDYFDYYYPSFWNDGDKAWCKEYDNGLFGYVCKYADSYMGCDWALYEGGYMVGRSSKSPIESGWAEKPAQAKKECDGAARQHRASRTRKRAKVDWRLEEYSDEQTLRMLCDSSAFTWEGMSSDPSNLDAICDAFERDGLWTNPDEPVVFYVVKGRDMNRMENLTGSNAYPDDLNILSIANDQLRIEAMIPIQFNYDARWMDDIVDNNRMREKEGGMGFYSRCKTAAEDLSWVCRQFEYEPEVCFQSEIDHYFQIIKNVNEAWAFNYYSDYWGSADEYQQDNVDLIEMLEPYIGKMVRFDSYIEGEHTLVGIAIDKQYNSVSHTRIVLAD